MLFFSPLLWYPGERADLQYNFVTETSESGSNAREVAAQKKCGYEFWDGNLADGILVSRTLLGSCAKVVKDNGHYMVKTWHTDYPTILDYAKTRKRNIPTFADPGTWSYANHFKLPEYLYDTDDLINYYNDMQYDLAGSVDWPIIDKICQVNGGKRSYFDLNTKTKEMRRKLTLELAADFLKKCNRRPDLQFVPFGTIQGYSMSTYRESMREILKMGYKYIAIGGLPAYSEETVIELLPMLSSEMRRAGHFPGMHLYGRFPSPKYVNFYVKHRVTSIDNNSAFLSASRSPCVFYDPEFLANEEWQTPTLRCYGIKIPPTRGPLLSRLRRKDENLYEKVKKACDRTFRLFCVYARKESNRSKKKFLSQYLEMDRVLNEARLNPLSENKMKEGYRRAKKALEYEGWKRCGCYACKNLGAHNVLVRGQRIPYIFLHNTWIHYQRLRHELSKLNKTVVYGRFNWKPILSLTKIKNKRRSIRRRKNGRSKEK